MSITGEAVPLSREVQEATTMSWYGDSRLERDLVLAFYFSEE